MGNTDKSLYSGVVGWMIDPRNVLECENAFVINEQITAWEDMEKRCEAILADASVGEALKEIQRDLLENTIRPILKELKRAS